MGLNIDLIQMFGPFEIKCPHCGHVEPAEKYGLDDKDVDCTNYNPEPGVWAINTCCFWGCEKEFSIIIHVKIDHISIDKQKKRSET